MPVPTPVPPAPHRRTLPAVVAGVVLGTLWGLSALTPMATARPTVSYERQSAAQALWHTQALYAAEAGIDEVRARLRPSAGVQRIVDTAPDDPTWGVRLGVLPDGPQADLSLVRYTPVASVQDALPTTVLLRHALHASAGTVLRWGDAQGTGVASRNTTHGEPVYLLTAHSRIGAVSYTVEVEAVREVPPTVPAALYAGGLLHIASPTTYLDGMDSCGTQHQAGVQTPLASPLTPPRGAHLSGTPPARGQGPGLQVRQMVETLQPRAVTLEHARASWSQVSTEASLPRSEACVGAPIVSVATHATQGHLTPDVTGCGLLLVAGDLTLDGAFTWSGPVLVTGALRLTGQSRTHVTGGVVVGGAVTMEAGATTTIRYCSTAIAQPMATLPLRIVSWRTILPAT